MESSIFKDIEHMHDYYGVENWVVEKMASNDKASIQSLINFRIKTMLAEEFGETMLALDNKDAEEVIDGLIDLIVIAAGTLDILGVDKNKAWREVLKANLNKTPGVKPERPNPLGLPDLIKPDGWVAPDHTGNHGLLEDLWNSQSLKSS